MSTNVLRIDASMFGEQGVSYQLNDQLIAKLQANYGELNLVQRNLAEQALPHFDAVYVQALSTEVAQRSPEQTRIVAEADALIQEVQEADILVVAAPMYNFGIPSQLKAWLDYIARAGTTFRYTENGPEGLIKNKTLYLVTTRGGQYRNTAADSEVPHLQTYFSFLGFEDIRVIYAEGLNMGLKDQGLASAKEQMETYLSV